MATYLPVYIVSGGRRALTNLSVNCDITSPFVPNPDVPDDAHNTNEPYLEYYQFLMNQTNADIPQVISNSYGDDEQVDIPLPMRPGNMSEIF